MPQYVDSSGRLYDVDEGSEREAAAQGLTPATDQNLQEHNQKAKYGSLGQQAQTFAEGAVSAVTAIPGMVRGAAESAELFYEPVPGLVNDEPDYGSLIEGFGSEEDIRGRAKENPIARAAGGAAVEVGAAIATGGTSLGAIAAESLAGGAIAAQELAFQEGREFVHEDLEADAKNLAIMAGLGMVVGSAPIGLSALRKAKAAKSGAAKKAVTEELQHVEASAQAKALGTASSDVAEAGAERAAAGEVADTAAERAAVEDVAEGVLQKADRKAMESEAEEIVERATKDAALPKEAPGIKRDAALSRNAPAIKERAVRELRAEFNALNKNKASLSDGEMRRADVIKNLSDNKEGQVAQARAAAVSVSELIGKLKANAQELGEVIGRAEGTKPKPRFEAGTASLVTDLQKAQDRLLRAESGAEAFHAVDGLKRTMQKRKLRLEAGAKQAPESSSHYATIEALEPLQERIRLGAEAEDVWGDMGKFQKARNKVYSDKLIVNSKAYNQAHGKILGRDYEANMIIDAVEENIDSLIANPNQSGRRYVSNMLEALEEMADIDATYSVRGGGTEATKASISKIRRTFGLTDEVLAAESRFEALNKVPGVGVAAEAVAGGLMDGFRRLAGAVDRNVNRSVDDWIHSSQTRGAVRTGKPKRPATAKKLKEPSPGAQAALRRGFTRTMANFMQGDEKPQTAYKRRTEQLQDPERFAETVAEKYADAARVSPDAATLLTSYAYQARDLLLSKRPAAIAVSMSNPNGYPPSDDAIADWATYVNAVENPLDILDRMGVGDVKAQEVEVLKSLEPLRPLYESIQARLLDRFQDIDPRNPVDDQMLMKMNLLFDLDGAGSGAFSNRAADAARNAQPAQPAGGGRAGRKPSQQGQRADPASIAQTGPTYGTQ